MSRFKREDELLDCERDEYMNLVQKLTQHGDVSIHYKKELIPIELLRKIDSDLERLRKEYGN